MEIKVENLSKRYLYKWIIKDMNHTFQSGSVTGINGLNGSGKSTYIKMLSGFLSPSKGKITYSNNDTIISRDDIYSHVSLAAPYTDIIMEYTVREMYDFHTKFKTLRSISNFDEFQEVVRLSENSDTQIQFYSSGMKQRLQLALAVMTDTSLLLLDEPTSYLDSENKAWFYKLLGDNLKDKTVIIASNDAEDFQYCAEEIVM